MFSTSSRRDRFGTASPHLVRGGRFDPTGGGDRRLSASRDADSHGWWVSNIRPVTCAWSTATRVTVRRTPQRRHVPGRPPPDVNGDRRPGDRAGAVGTGPGPKRCRRQVVSEPNAVRRYRRDPSQPKWWNRACWVPAPSTPTTSGPVPRWNGSDEKRLVRERRMAARHTAPTDTRRVSPGLWTNPVVGDLERNRLDASQRT